MFYVKFDEAEGGQGELIAAESDHLWFSRVFIEALKTGTDDSDWDAFSEAAKAIGRDYSVAHVGDMTPQHPDGERTVSFVQWFDQNGVGHLATTTRDIYILNSNGKTLDRV